MPLIIRAARAEDSATLLRLLRLLAAFEGEPESVRTNADQLRADGFGPDPKFEALLAESDGAVHGMLIHFPAYSSWHGAPTLMIHDLFIEESWRGQGTGAALLRAAAKLAVARGCCRLDVNVVAENDAGRRFYQRLGFRELNSWRPHRLSGAALTALAKK